GPMKPVPPRMRMRNLRRGGASPSAAGTCDQRSAAMLSSDALMNRRRWMRIASPGWRESASRQYPCAAALVPGALLMHASERARKQHPARGDRQRAHRDRPELEPERLQAVEHPARRGIGAAIDHHVDHVLRLLLGLATDDGEKHLARRIRDREVDPALDDLE